MKKKLLSNINYLLEQFLIVIPFLITIYATKQYGEEIYANIIFLINIISNLYIFSNLSSPKPYFHLTKIYNKERIQKTILTLNKIFAGLTVFGLVITALIYQGSYMYLIPLSILNMLMVFKFLRFADLGTENSNKTSSIFILATVVGALIKLVAAMYQLDQIYFFAGFIVEGLITSLYLIYINRKANFKELKLKKEDFKITISEILPFFIMNATNKIYSICLVYFIYITFLPEYLIIYFLAMRINNALSMVLLALDNILLSYKNFKSNYNYLLFSISLGLLGSVSVLMVINYIIIPILGNKYIYLSTFYLYLIPLTIISSFNFFYLQKNLEKKRRKNNIIASLITFAAGILALFFVTEMEHIIIVLYMKAIIYLVSMHVFRKIS